MDMVNKDYGDTTFITGMRAFAAYAVVMVHSGGAGIHLVGPWGLNFTDLGKWGVYVFFVISGFSVAASYSSATGYFDYLNKRLWRIAPIYYFWIAAAILLGTTATYYQQRFNVSIDARNILLHLSFLSFLDYKITNSILGVEWSISIEVFWYLLLPIIFFIGRARLLLTILTIAALWSYWYLKKYPDFVVCQGWQCPISNNEDAALLIYWSPMPYAFAYCLGVLAHRLRSSVSGFTGDAVLLAVFGLLACYLADPTRIDAVFYDVYVFICLLTFVLLLFGSGRSRLFNIVFTNRVILHLGTISYGVYLSHYPLMNLGEKLGLHIESLPLKFLVVAALATLVSTATYFWVERPALNFGRDIFK